ncbi:MAG TPA: hypothetical protein VJ672_04080, partial [Gemmatimonadaceae bacterium]|nr:hypothetical protein [Gemmatimonadaceae bacterium]
MPHAALDVLLARPSQLLLDGSQMSFPYVSRQAKKIPARSRIVGQKARERCVPFSYVAGNTGRNYVASRAVSAAHAGLH